MIQSTIIRFLILLTLTLSCGESGTGGGEGGPQNESPPMGSNGSATPSTEPQELKAVLDVTVYPITYKPEYCSENFCTFVMTYTNSRTYPVSGLGLACNLNPLGVFDSASGSAYSNTVNPGEIRQLSCSYTVGMAPGPDLNVGSIVLTYTSTPTGTKSKYTYKINR